MQKMKKKYEVEFRGMITVLILFLVLVFVDSLFIFSFTSVKISCSGNFEQKGTGEILEEIENNDMIGGAFIVTPTDETFIVVKSPSESTLAHEKCHEQQYNENRLYGCGNKLGAFVNEMECYLVGWSVIG